MLLQCGFRFGSNRVNAENLADFYRVDLFWLLIGLNGGCGYISVVFR
jgi:hypothetical protein